MLYSVRIHISQREENETDQIPQVILWSELKIFIFTSGFYGIESPLCRGYFLHVILHSPVSFHSIPSPPSPSRPFSRTIPSALWLSLTVRTFIFDLPTNLSSHSTSEVSSWAGAARTSDEFSQVILEPRIVLLASAVKMCLCDSSDFVLSTFTHFPWTFPHQTFPHWSEKWFFGWWRPSLDFRHGFTISGSDKGFIESHNWS